MTIVETLSPLSPRFRRWLRIAVQAYPVSANYGLEPEREEAVRRATIWAHEHIDFLSRRLGSVIDALTGAHGDFTDQERAAIRTEHLETSTCDRS